MAKIISRTDPVNEALEKQRVRLQTLLSDASLGFFGIDGPEVPAETLEGLISQLDELLAVYMVELELATATLIETEDLNLNLAVKLAERDELIETLVNGVEYDEDLDHTTTDFMEMLIGSGAAEPTFDGDITFDAGVVFTPSDLKPYVREAILTWLRLKTS